MAAVCLLAAALSASARQQPTQQLGKQQKLTGRAAALQAAQEALQGRGAQWDNHAMALSTCCASALPCWLSVGRVHVLSQDMPGQPTKR